LVGRDGELGRLIDAVSSPPSVVVVCGEAGVGKTRLVREVAGAADRAARRVLVGHCHPSGEPFPLGPLIEALGPAGDALPLGPLPGALHRLGPEWAEHLPPDPGPMPGAGARRHRVFRALRALLEGLGRTLCILEDLQWADEETLEFLVYLASAPPRDLSLVLTCQTEGGDPPSGLPGTLWRLLRPGAGSTIALDPLAPCDVREQVAGLLGCEAVSHEFATCLHGWTGGVPFAVEEVVGQLRGELGLDAMTPERWPALETLPVPAAIGEPLVARLAELSENARLIASAAAVVGRPAHEELLSGVAGVRARAGTTGLLEALAAGVLQERGDGLYGFRHGLATRAVYETIRGPVRRRCHQRAARALECAGDGELLAELVDHLKASGSRTWPQYAEAAAEEAASAGDDRLAARLLEDALCAPELSRAARIRMVLALGDAAIYSVSPSRAIGILRRTLEEETLPAGVRGEMRFSLSRLLGHAGDAAASRSEAVRAVGELRRRPALGVRAMINLAQPLWTREGEVEDHYAWLDQAVRTAGRQTDRVARIAVSSQRAAILLSLGDPAGWAAVRDIPAAGDIPKEKLQLSRGYLALSEASLGLGHYGRAACFLKQACLLHDQAGNRSWGLWLEFGRISQEWCAGRWEGLEGRLRRCEAKTESVPALSVGNRFLLGSVLLARGELDDAGRTLSSALEAARRSHNFSQIAAASARLARLYLHWEDPRRALDTVTETLGAVRGKRLWVAGRIVVPEAVQALLACGEHASARAVVAEFSMGLRHRDAPAARAALGFCRGALAEAEGHPDAALCHFARADASWGRLPNHYEAARARERSAQCSVGEDAASAEGLLLSAWQTFDGLGAQGDARRVRAQLKARGVWRGGRNGYGEELSPREAQVAGLAGGGLTNREIAEALCISPRTVEVHVAAALRKLRLRSRHDLGDEQPATKDT